MKKILIMWGISMVVSSITYGYVVTDYNWITNPANGHQYALTLGTGTWKEMEEEAESIGEYLVTINDPVEHAWLGLEFEQQLDQDNYLWIGFYQDHNDPGYSEPAGGWKWISGDLVTYVGWDPPEPTNHPPGEDYGVITGSPTNHWNDWGPDSQDYPLGGIRGIIEVPEPTTLLLLGLGGVMLRKRK